MQKRRVRQSKHNRISELKVDFINAPSRAREAGSPVARELIALLSKDLGFHDAPVNNGAHNFHSFLGFVRLNATEPKLKINHIET